jgi:hypothetical protein
MYGLPRTIASAWGAGIHERKQRCAITTKPAPSEYAKQAMLLRVQIETFCGIYGFESADDLMDWAAKRRIMWGDALPTDPPPRGGILDHSLPVSVNRSGVMRRPDQGWQTND